jgi:hypothetical protein
MLLKASIVHRGGRIRDPGEKNTIGFDACVRRALSTNTIKFLSEEQVLTLQALNGLRDAAQHHLIDMSEVHQYIQAQSGVTLYRDILRDVFDDNLRDLLPERVLPISTVAPVDPIALFAEEVSEVKRLLAPGMRRGAEALARLRAMAIVDGAMNGERLQPSESELRKISVRVGAGETKLDSLFPGISGISFSVEGSGPTVSLRIAKKDGVPVTLMPEGTSGSRVVSVKRVNELDFYNLRFLDLKIKLGITPNQVTALIDLLGIKESEDYSKYIISTWCYSQKAFTAMREALKEKPVAEWWREYRQRDQ